MGSLQDALLKAGVADEKQSKEKRRGKPGASASGSDTKRPADARGQPGRGKKGRKKTNAKSGSSEQSDLARAYQARKAAEAREKEQAKKSKVEAQEARRKRNLALDAVIEGNCLNRRDAELPRYFEHLGRIRRVLCTPEQRDQLNRGDLGVVNLRGSYLLVSLETLEKYRAIAPDLVPDLSGVEPEDDGSHYPPVPDDLIW